MTPDELVEWAIEQSDIESQQEKQAKKAQLKILVDAIKVSGAAILNAGVVQDLLTGLKNIPAAAQGIGKAADAIQNQYTSDQAYYSTRAAMEAADKAEERYKNNPSAKNTKNWLVTQAEYKMEADNYLSVTGNPWRKNLTFAPEVLAYIDKQKNKKATEEAAATQQALETARESRRVTPVMSTAAQTAAETRREDRRAVTATMGPTPQVQNVTTSNISPNDPRVLALTKNNLYTLDEAIAKVAAQQAQIDIATGSGGGGTGTQSSYRIFDAEQTAGFANTIAQNLLGRTLTAEELNNLTNTLNTQSKAKPTTVKTVGGSAVQSGGIDAEQVVKSELQLAPEFETYQKATTYFEAMLGALRGTAGGGI